MALNIAYAHLVAQMPGEQREAFDQMLMSDPAAEQRVLRALA